MNRVIVSSLIVALLLSASLSAKGVTTRVTIRDTSLQTSFDLSDRSLLDRFNVWAGPGTFQTAAGRGAEGVEGFIVDWKAGVVDRPEGVRRYEVRFYVTYPNSAAEQLAYVVFFEPGPSPDEGFIYLPGKSDEQYWLNVKAIYRGDRIEGHWFRATTAWQDAVRQVMSR
jgi:hypothetical protein